MSGRAMRNAANAVRRASRPAAATGGEGASSFPVSPSEGNHTPRVVFGPAPSQDEARQAALEITSALETTHSSSTFSANDGGQGSAPSESRMNLAWVGQVGLQALSLMRRRQDVQHVITSVVTNRNVWNEVMNDEAVRDFFSNHMSVRHVQTGPSLERMEMLVDEPSEFISWLFRVIQTLVEMLYTTSNFLESICGILGGGFGLRSTDSNNRDAMLDQTPIGLSILLLAITTMLVVLLKRSAA